MKEALLRKYLKGEANPEEVQQVLQWISSGKAPESISRLFEGFDPSKSHEKIDSEKILQNIHYLINVEESLDFSDIHSSTFKNRIFSKDREPLARGKKPLLGKLKKTAVYSLIGVIFLTVLYLVPQHLSKPTVVAKGNDFVKKSTEKGQKLHIQLSDGSRITLNSASAVIYQENFNDSIRQIELFGEAYFMVSRDTLRPFVVKTGELEARVLGTSFNIQYRPENNINNVALITGKVEVSFNHDNTRMPMVLLPGEIARIDFKTHRLMQDKFDPEQVLAWRDGIIHFANAGYEEIIQVLENWYGVKIATIGMPREGWEFSAKFENESLRTVLDALQYAQDITYTLKDKHVTIEFAKGSGS